MRPNATRLGPFLALAVVALLGAAAPTQAIYIATPLTLDPKHSASEPGEDVGFTVGPSPDNESAREDWAGKTVKARFGYNPNEGSDSDHADSDMDYVLGEIGTITLDDKAAGAFTWTVPAEVDGKNVDVFLESDDGERLAFAYLAVGDAPPVMRTMAGGAEDPERLDSEAPGVADDNAENGEAPSPGIAALMVFLAAAAVGMTVLLRRA